MTPNKEDYLKEICKLGGGDDLVANKQIADQLSATEETVKSRVKSILSKLGASDRTQAAIIGVKRGIIEL